MRERLAYLLKLILARPAIAAMFFVIGVAVVSMNISGEPVMLGEVYNLNDPQSVQQLSYKYPETAAAVEREFPQNGTGRAVLYVSTVNDPE